MSANQLNDLIIKQPVSVLNKVVKIDYRSFFTSLGKLAVSGASHDVPASIEHGLDLIKEIGVKKQPEQVAWMLISQALMQALSDLVEDYDDLFPEESELNDEVLAELAKDVEYTLNALEISLDASFFDKPQQLVFLDDFKSVLAFWLKGLGWNEAQADAFHLRLKSRFVFTLNEIWANSPENYEILEKRLKTPFSKETLEQRNWIRYNASLQEYANERVFNEAFSLRQVYIPLNAYYDEERKDDEDNEIVVRVAINLHEHINNWIGDFDKDNALKIVSGGPGCGKSSFSKILVAEIAEKKEIPVLFVPLHHFDPSKDLIQAVEDFISYDKYLTGNPLDPKKGQERLLIVFDGLDELSMQGHAAAEVAQSFVDEVIRSLDRFNSNGNLKRQVIITGRDLAIQSSKQRLRKAKQILHMLPYYLNPHEQINYEDKTKALAHDLRSDWWEKFGKAKGNTYKGIPKSLQKENLTPITREPLLNYLIALSYERKEIDFDSGTTLNTIYEDLLRAVYQRQWDTGGQHKGVEHLTEEEFFRILEEIALAIWHGNGRTATEEAIYKRCEDSHLTRYLEKFTEGAKKGVVRLLTAFYFREFGKESSGDRTFEFTHKSFGEYLTAKRIVRTVEDIQDETERHQKNPDKGYNTRDALEAWAKICGPTEMDQYLYQFVRDEVAAYDLDTLLAWQYTFIYMLGFAVRESMPMEKLELNSFANMLKQSRNAQEGILAVHAACFTKTGKVIGVGKNLWGDRTAFGTFWKRVQGQRSGSDNPLVARLLTGLDLRDCILYFSDFYRANLSGSKLFSARLAFVYLLDAKLKRADLRESNLRDAHLERADLEGADLEGADLEGANLEGANLKRANLRGANLEGANLEGANLQGTNLQGTNLQGTNLEGTILEKE